MLAAPSYVGITSVANPPLFLGVDSRAHYDANVHASLATRGLQGETVIRINAVKTVLIAAKNKVFPPTLRRFDDLRRRYADNDIPFGAYLEKLSHYGVRWEPTPLSAKALLASAARME